MKVIVIEKMFLLCVVYNTLLLFLNTYINHRNNYSRMFIMAIVFSILDIISIYIGNTYLYIIFMLLFFAVPIAMAKVNIIREIFVVSGLVFLCVGAYAIIPFSNIYINICVVIISVFISGVIPVFQKNRYIRTTLAKVRFSNNVKIEALIDTGIVAGNIPLVIVNPSCLKSIMPYLTPMHSMNISTISGYGSMGIYIANEIEVCIDGKKRIIHNAQVAVSEKKLPWDALISAQGLV